MPRLCSHRVRHLPRAARPPPRRRPPHRKAFPPQTPLCPGGLSEASLWSLGNHGLRMRACRPSPTPCNSGWPLSRRASKSGALCVMRCGGLGASSARPAPRRPSSSRLLCARFTIRRARPDARQRRPCPLPRYSGQPRRLFPMRGACRRDARPLWRLAKMLSQRPSVLQRRTGRRRYPRRARSRPHQRARDIARASGHLGKLRGDLGGSVFVASVDQLDGLAAAVQTSCSKEQRGHGSRAVGRSDHLSGARRRRRQGNGARWHSNGSLPGGACRLQGRRLRGASRANPWASYSMARRPGPDSQAGQATDDEGQQPRHHLRRRLGQSGGEGAQGVGYPWARPTRRLSTSGRMPWRRGRRAHHISQAAPPAAVLCTGLKAN